MGGWFDPRFVLRLAAIYKGYQSLIGGRRARKLYVHKFVKPRAGNKILDIGCGPGDILDFLPDVQYFGVDVDPDYIAAARKNYGDRGVFACQCVEESNVLDPGTFDIVLAAGVLHHLDDEDARTLFRASAKALKPEGRLVTLDGCFLEGQNTIARLLLKADRGEHVRTQSQYESLAQSTFRRIDTSIEERFFHVPYTLLVMDCRGASDDRGKFNLASI